MKKTTLLIVTCSILFAACGNNFDLPQDAIAPVGYGRVAVTLNSAARTVFPALAFERYVYEFAKITGSVGT